MRVLISGSTGFVGSALVDYLQTRGHQVVRLMRGINPAFRERQVLWDIRSGKLNPADLAGIEAVVHLAGENIASGRWTEEKKQKIVQSRVAGTRLLAETLAKMDNPPHTFICASAVGYYGDRGSEVLTEVSGPGQGFLARTCVQWEQAAQSAAAKGIRVVHLRLGMVLHPDGGALKAMIWPFRLGLAGNLGLKGRQYLSWITRDDVIGAIDHVLNHPGLRGPVNAVSPHPVTNAEFTRLMRKKLVPPFLPMHYWTPPMPAPLLQALTGEMGRELLLASARVQPVRLLETGYTFKYPDLKSALDRML